MTGAVERLVLRWLRVPPPPTMPDGERVVRVFRAAVPYFRYRLGMWLLGRAAGVVAIAFALMFSAEIVRAADEPWVTVVVAVLEALAVAGFLVSTGVGYVALKLDYEQRWYLLSDRSLRVREGIWNVQEKTITFANIQQISIRQNPLQRLVGISDVQVTTAGGGAATGGNPHGAVGESMHEAYFRGVDNAEEIRRVIRERVEHYRDAGLGDPDDHHPPALDAPHAAALPAAGASDVLDAARELLGEVRRLRIASGAG